MLQRVFLYFIVPMVFIAFFLSIFGVQQIELGNAYYSFMKSVGNSLDNWKFSIPDIPKIPEIVKEGADTGGKEVLKVLRNFVNFFVKFINVITSIINIFIAVINVIINIVQFILTIIYQCKDFINKQASVKFAYV